jgi:hypothetical protein
VYFEKMKVEKSPSETTFWGFSPLENFGISKIFEEKATFRSADESLNVSKIHFDSKSINVFNLTPMNAEYLRPVFIKLKEEEVSFGVYTDTSSLIFLWFERDDFSQDIRFYYKNEKIADNLKILLNAKSFSAKNACDPWFDFALSSRQIKVFKFVIQGSSNKAIAEEIFQSEKTVEAEISKIAKKLKIETKASTKENPRVMFVRKYAQILKVI